MSMYIIPDLPEAVAGFDKAETYVPDHIRGGILRYIEHGIEPGSFLSAVICNDLVMACQQADDINRHYIFTIVSWFYNYAPSNCWQGERQYVEWIKARREA